MDKQLAQLVRMGFSWETSKVALDQTDGDCQKAITLLLAGPTTDQSPGVTMEPEPEAMLPARLPQGDATFEKLQSRAAHQSATLSMLREAGASEEELRVLVADVEMLDRQIAEYSANEDASRCAREKAAQAQQKAEERRSAAARRANELIAQQRADAEAVRAEAEQADRAQLLAEREAHIAELEADMARAREENTAAQSALREAVEEELAVAEHYYDAEQSCAAQLLQSCLAMEWQATFGEPAFDTDEAGSQFVVYPMTVTTPHGRLELIKRYSDFMALKQALAESVISKEVRLSDTPFPAKTWTSWLMQDGEAIVADRQKVLSSWLNAVLMLCPDAASVVEFISGSEGLLQSVLEAE